jgi:hyperosmotically inducible periplasmic protein
MKAMKSVSVLALAFALAAAVACSEQRKAPDVSDNVRNSLNQAGLESVKVSQDRDKGVVTLSGDVQTDDEKARAETVARAVAGNQVVANEIGVRPTGNESIAKKVDSDLDAGIEKNLSATLVQHRLKKDVRYDVSNGVVTLKGSVTSAALRDSAEQIAQKVPNVKQVVNELEVKGQKATSTK